MNPFTELSSFEAMRDAARAGREDLERYLRSYAAIQRREKAAGVAVRLSARIQRMVRLAIASSRAVLLVGPPGTGKTEILRQVIDEFAQDPALYGFSVVEISALWVTPEEEWTFDSIVLGETVVSGEIESTEGALLEAIRSDQWLVLDEANRADMDRVLGGVLTWLSGQPVKIGTWKRSGDPTVPAFLGWETGPKSDVVVNGVPAERRYLAGTDWRLLGTYNAVDAQRVFRMGQALSRRFKHVPIPPASPTEFDELIKEYIADGEWAELLRERLGKLYGAHLIVEGAQLGPGLFTDIPRYVEYGLQYPKSVPPDEQAERVDQLLTEGYFASVGSLLAKFEPQALETLAVRMLQDGALSEDSWEWITNHLSVIRP